LSLFQLMTPVFLETGRRLTVRCTYSELSGNSTLDFMLEGAEAPLYGTLDASVREQVKKHCHDVVEEPTARGLRVKFLL
ncbi:MAG: hypothetical protein K6E35_05480, partial [Bacteroidales bacterium]|nr:hypothetical protein [Bacteroidales bacterium]